MKDVQPWDFVLYYHASGAIIPAVVLGTAGVGKRRYRILCMGARRRIAYVSAFSLTTPDVVVWHARRHLYR